MGFGFNLYFMLILVPLTGILLIIWLFSRKRIVSKTLGLIWLGVFGLATLVTLLNWLTSKTELDKDDYYGEYIIKRDYFKGEQTDWQYNHYRFEITKSDSIFYYVTDEERILEAYRGTIKTTDPRNHKSARLIIDMEEPTHHILKGNPTTYRSAWDFYLVFKSTKFHIVFFEKGKWKPIE